MNNKNYASPFFGNNYCLIAEYNLAFVSISKNGVTHLDKIAIHSKTGYWPQSSEEAHDMIGYNPATSQLLYSIQEREILKEQFPNLVFIAVWRDPVERLISCYKHFILEKAKRYYFNYLNLYNDSSFDRFIEFVCFELGKSDPLFQDEHIRRQSDYYTLDDVDIIVPINKLNSFLEEQGIFLTNGKSNETKVDFEIESMESISLIEELYKEDFEIIKSHKVYNSK